MKQSLESLAEESKAGGKDKEIPMMYVIGSLGFIRCYVRDIENSVFFQSTKKMNKQSGSNSPALPFKKATIETVIAELDALIESSKETLAELVKTYQKMNEQVQQYSQQDS